MDFITPPKRKQAKKIPTDIVSWYTIQSIPIPTIDNGKFALHLILI